MAVLGQHTGKFDIQTAFTIVQRNLFQASHGLYTAQPYIPLLQTISEYSYIRTSPGANPDAVTDVIIEDNSFDIAKNAVLLGGNATNTSGVLIHNNRYNEVDKRLETNVNKDSYLVIDDNL